MATLFTSIGTAVAGATSTSTLSAVGAGLAVAGTGFTALGTYQQAKAQQEASRYNAQVARIEANAKSTQIRRDNARKIATARAQSGASGVAIGGSSISMLADLAAQGEEMALLALYGGEAESTRSLLRAEAAGSAATGSLLAGGINTGATLLQGAADHRANFPTLE